MQGLLRLDFMTCLGDGGFGEVYRAKLTLDSGLTSEVAVKLLHEEVDPESVAARRLLDEARLLSVLKHPNVIHVRDLAVIEGRLALIAEYVEGADLDVCCRVCKPHIPLRPQLEVIQQVAEALDAAYNAPGPQGEPLRLVHRDIKPSNIRIGTRGEVKVLDFGVARANMDRAAITATQHIVGSMPYLAPERFRGRDTHAGDVFALGCSLYEGLAHERFLPEALEQRERFTIAGQPDAHAAHLEEKLEKVSWLPSELRTLIRDMLAYDAEDRPTAAEVAERIEELAVELPPPTLRKWCRKTEFPAARPVKVSSGLTGRTVMATPFSHQDLGSMAPSLASLPPVPDATLGERQPTSESGAYNRSAVLGGTFVGFGTAMGGMLCLVGGLAVAWFASQPGEAVPEPSAVVAPVPAPEPVVAPVAAPEPVAEPAPVVAVASPDPEPVAAPAPVAARPKPAPAPTPSGGQVTVEGAERVYFVDANGRHPAGRVPAGSYDIIAFFHDQPVTAGSIEVADGAEIKVVCYPKMLVCVER